MRGGERMGGDGGGGREGWRREGQGGERGVVKEVGVVS